MLHCTVLGATRRTVDEHFIHFQYFKYFESNLDVSEQMVSKDTEHPKATRYK